MSDGNEHQQVGADNQEGSGMGAVTLSAQDLLSLVERTITNRLAKEEPKEKKLKVEALRYKGNQKQLDFNSSIREKVSKAIRSFQSQDAQKGEEILLDVKEAIDVRNKMVRLADRSGWDVVEEYMGDSIASDSDDERKIRSAEQRAMRKRKFAGGSQPFRRAARGSWPRAESHIRSGPYSGFQGFSTMGNQRFSSQFHGAAGSSGVGSFNRGNSQSSKVQGTCYYCGKAGHWATDCDQRKK